MTTQGTLLLQIEVTPLGIEAEWLERELGLEAGALARWEGDELGAPRDYGMRHGRTFFTAAGVRRAAELAGVKVEVTEGGSTS